MHELTLAGGIVDVVAAALAAEPGARLKRVVIEVGVLSGVELRALRFALEALAPQSVLDGVQLQFDERGGGAWCLGCSQQVDIASRADACPHCGGHWLQANAGTELKVRELIVEDG